MSNAAYYCLGIANILLTAYQADALSSVVSMRAYPDTVRRLFIDAATEFLRILAVKFLITFRCFKKSLSFGGFILNFLFLII